MMLLLICFFIKEFLFFSSLLSKGYILEIENYNYNERLVNQNDLKFEDKILLDLSIP
jgi:hypothetical protein